MAGEEKGTGSAERIREAALEGFSREGIEATSIRKVAKAAGVSAGLVQHHFANKAALQEAVDAHVLATLVGFFDTIPEAGTAEEFFREMGNAVTKFVSEQPTMLRYVAFTIIEGAEPSLRIFDAFVAVGDDLAQRLHDEGFLRDDVDLLWVSLHVATFNLSCVLFEGAFDRRLPAPFYTPEMLERWNRATTEMFRVGWFKPNAG